MGGRRGAVNAFLLAIILVGAAAFWLLGAGVQSLALGDDVEKALFVAAAVASLFCAYYFGRWLHDLISARLR